VQLANCSELLRAAIHWSDAPLGWMIEAVFSAAPSLRRAYLLSQSIFLYRHKPPRIDMRQRPFSFVERFPRSEAHFDMENTVYWSPYGGTWTDAIPHLSRLQILEKEFGTDAKRPIRPLFVGLTMVLAPLVIAAAVLGVGFLAK
jgi:hypothetical protein